MQTDAKYSVFGHKSQALLDIGLSAKNCTVQIYTTGVHLIGRVMQYIYTPGGPIVFNTAVSRVYFYILTQAICSLLLLTG